RHTHPSTEAIPEYVRQNSEAAISARRWKVAEDVPSEDRRPATWEETRSIFPAPPRRKEPRVLAVWRCPVCGQERRLGGSRQDTLMNLNTALEEAGEPDTLPVDISYM